MPISQEQFRKRLTDSGLMSLADMKAFEGEQPEPVPDGDPSGLASALVEAGRLTSFQAETLLADTERPLRLGNYVLIDTVGAGGMGQVYKAVHERMKRVVALKLLPPMAAMDAGLVARFRREVQVAAKLHHPGIVTAYDADESGGLHYLVMELVDGRDLAAIVDERGPLPVDRALDYTRQTAEALAYAHSEGVLHRDIKPGNLLVNDMGRVKVLDMGLARLEASEGLTSTGDVIGSAHTMAPEQGDDIRLVDERSDVYALGCTLYYLVTGRHVYEGDSALRVLIKHAQEPVPSLRAVRSDVPEAVDALFQRMVQKKREDRYADMGAVMEAIDAVRGGDADATPASEAAATGPRSSRRALLAAGAIGLAGTAVGLWHILSGSDGNEQPTPPQEDVVTGATFVKALRGHQDSVYGLVMHPDDKHLYSVSADGTVGAWNPGSGELKYALEGHAGSVRSIVLTKDGHTAITSSDDTTIRIWDLGKRTTRNVLSGHQEKARQVVLAPDETWLASASKDGSLRIWDYPSGAERFERRRHGMGEDDNRGLLGVTIHPDGRSLATSAYDKTIKIWDTKEFEVQTTLGPHTTDVGVVRFSPDGKYLLYDLANGKVRVMTADGSEEVAVLSSHLEWVYAIGFSGDGSLVATGSQDMTVKLWSMPEGKLIDTLAGHEDTVNATAFDRGADLLYTSGADATIRVWKLERGPAGD